MTPCLWKRQPGESAADFTAFAAYLRLKGRRSHRAVAVQTNRSPGAIRRLASQYHWVSRVAAFEERLAEAAHNTLESLVQADANRLCADYERFRDLEFQLTGRVLQEAPRWLELAMDPRRANPSMTEICRLFGLASTLSRLAVGMPTGASS
jgi:hypothetical protein